MKASKLQAILKDTPGIKLLSREELPTRQRSLYDAPITRLPFWNALLDALQNVKAGAVNPEEISFEIDLNRFDKELKGYKNAWKAFNVTLNRMLRPFRDKKLDRRGTILGGKIEIRRLRDAKKVYFIGVES